MSQQDGLNHLIYNFLVFNNPTFENAAVVKMFQKMKHEIRKFVSFFMWYRGRFYGWNWSTFGSPRCSKNEPGVKIFLSLYDEKMHPIHIQTESGPELSFY